MSVETVASKDKFIKKCRVHVALKQNISQRSKEFNTDEIFTDESLANVLEKMRAENMKLLEERKFAEKLEKVKEIRQKAPLESDWKPSFIPVIDMEAKYVVSKRMLLEKITSEYNSIKNINEINEGLLANMKKSLDAKVKTLNSL
ncbi:unnamed protein product [Oikopleura dioica]|uniref:Uncharacterized protein n=1 Tax=Oikopleura dioica TaxID=34765 RepID=E4XXQ2_OIKDI|nr:unnamed protein product [Oikopleura dioica]CBY43046.1 unnamed protein product [Oikopleura dioica]